MTLAETRWLHNNCGADVITVTGIVWRCKTHGVIPARDVTAADPECDFCSRQPVTHALPAGDFLIPGQEGRGAAGRWLACQSCAGLILNGMWNGLLARAAHAFAASHHADRDAIRGVLEPVYDRLRRTAGELVPFAPERSKT